MEYPCINANQLGMGRIKMEANFEYYNAIYGKVYTLHRNTLSPIYFFFRLSNSINQIQYIHLFISILNKKLFVSIKWHMALIEPP